MAFEKRLESPLISEAWCASTMLEDVRFSIPDPLSLSEFFFFSACNLSWCNSNKDIVSLGGIGREKVTFVAGISFVPFFSWAVFFTVCAEGLLVSPGTLVQLSSKVNAALVRNCVAGVSASF